MQQNKNGYFCNPKELTYLAAEPVIAIPPLSPSPTIGVGRTETEEEEEVTALVSAKDGFVDSAATAATAAAIVDDDCGDSILARQ